MVLWSKAEELMMDEDMKQLFELTSKLKKNEDDVDAIISILQEKSPLLLDGLSISSQRRIALSCHLKIYYKDDFVFQQGEEPHSYYTVIYGTVSIYAKSDKHSTYYDVNDTTIDGRIKNYGQYLTKIMTGTSFGELSFNEDCKHSKRNATVISNGCQDLNNIQIISGAHEYDDINVQEKIPPPNFSIILMISEEVYMAELYKRHEFRHQTKNKISFLEKSILFQNFAYDDIVKISYSMKKKVFSEGSIISAQGQRSDFVVVVQKGNILINQKIMKITKRSVHSASTTTFAGKDIGNELVVEIAKIGIHDFFGLVEAVTNSKKMKREAVASTDVEAYLIQVSTFMAFFQKEPKSMKILERVVKNRLKWEALRQDFAMRFPNSMPLSLPKNANKLSNYTLL